jgi:hypothetical protein
VISKVINRVAVTLTVVLHLCVKAYSKYLDRKQQKAERIPGFPGTSSEKHSVSIGSGLFLLMTIVGGFLTNIGTREAQLAYLLPLQLTFCSVVFPVFVIFSNRKMKLKFLQTYPVAKSVYDLFVSKTCCRMTE